RAYVFEIFPDSGSGGRVVLPPIVVPFFDHKFIEYPFNIGTGNRDNCVNPRGGRKFCLLVGQFVPLDPYVGFDPGEVDQMFNFYKILFYVIYKRRSGVGTLDGGY
ncbi:hypothetical protein AVEN_274187-1, partial [Araneus ventricosus]